MPLEQGLALGSGHSPMQWVIMSINRRDHARWVSSDDGRELG